MGQVVSVIMPCYNDGRYIQDSIESVKKQTYPDIELIIIDDGSEDPLTISILKDIESKSDDIRVIHTKEKRGPAAARNEGIRFSKGKYILPLDSDDLIEPEYIKKAVKELERNNDVGIVYCHADLFGKQTGKWNLPDYSFELEIVDNLIFVTALFRKEDWENIGGFCEDFLSGMEDYDFWLSIIERGKSVIQLPDVLFHYRIKENSRTDIFMNSVNSVKETYKLIYYRHKNFLLSDENRDEYLIQIRNKIIDLISDNYHVEERIQTIINDYENSSSWKITKPFRMMADLFRKVFK